MINQRRIYLKRTGEKVSIAESSSESEAELIYATTEITKRDLPTVEADVHSVFNTPSAIRIAFDDLLKVIGENKTAYLGYGMGEISGKNTDAVKKAINTLLCVAENFNNMQAILINVCGNPKRLTMATVSNALAYIDNLIPKESKVYFGQQFDENLDNHIKILLILVKN